MSSNFTIVYTLSQKLILRNCFAFKPVLLPFCISGISFNFRKIFNTFLLIFCPIKFQILFHLPPPLIVLPILFLVASHSFHWPVYSGLHRRTFLTVCNRSMSRVSPVQWTQKILSIKGKLHRHPISHFFIRHRPSLPSLFQLRLNLSTNSLPQPLPPVVEGVGQTSLPCQPRLTNDVTAFNYIGIFT